MADAAISGKWRMRFWFVLLIFVLLFLQLLPLQTVPRSWAGPDLIVLFTVAWSVRRPEYVPTLLVAGLTLLVDLILLRPPGVMAAIMILARQTLKGQERGLRDSTFMAEWLVATLALATIALTNRVFLSVFLVDQAPLGMSLTELAMNVITYPFVALVSYTVFGLRKVSPGETDAIAGAT
ncbi:rod shape-determining protein MreD [uncultured Shimia sp.]|uniref:rod shape-determining protein MreD n=1 Tax=uncultured Shimia sp. TaxID=573152 RepID=UPI002619487C|nr:rod shape-determining protein MreD [uncultured Shimia sp.]